MSKRYFDGERAPAPETQRLLSVLAPAITAERAHVVEQLHLEIKRTREMGADDFVSTRGLVFTPEHPWWSKLAKIMKPRYGGTIVTIVLRRDRMHSPVDWCVDVTEDVLDRLVTDLKIVSSDKILAALEGSTNAPATAPTEGS